MVIKSYLQRSDKDLNRLMVYAKAFRIEKIIRQYTRYYCNVFNILQYSFIKNKKIAHKIKAIF